MFIQSQEMKNNIFQGLNLDNRNHLANLMQNIGGIITVDDSIRVNMRIFRIQSE